MGRTPRYAAAAVAAGALFAVLLVVSAGQGWSLLLDNMTQLGASAVASVACLRASRRVPPSRRETARAWLLLGIGTGCWASGQAVWSTYEVVLREPAPFPSWADAGFLLFVVVATSGLVSWLGSGARVAAQARDVLDGVVIATSLFLLSWGTALGSVVAAGAPDRAAFVLSLAYPVGDVVMATLALIALSRSRRSERGVLWCVTAGLGGLAVADSAFVYLVAEGSYATGSLISAGWVTGFLLVAAGALSSVAGEPGPSAPGPDGPARTDTGRQDSRLLMLLPYVPLVLAEAVVAVQLVRLTQVPVLSVVLGFALVALVLARQLIALNENRLLLAELAVHRDRLSRLALHDGLTGLPNRTLFEDRAQHALAARRRSGAQVAVLFCDLDGFKTVNDTLGHDAGDALLRLVAARLQASLRPGDTVARLGGDEFAVLLADPGDARAVAARVVRDVDQPCVLDGVTVQVRLSVGAAVSGELEGSGAALPPSEQVRHLLRAADCAMYAAKEAAKRARAALPAQAAGPATPEWPTDQPVRHDRVLPGRV